MPQAVDITIKNGASTPVDKTFTLISPAAGDGGLAQWWLKEGAIQGAFPVFTASANRTPNRGRSSKLKMRVPSSYVDASTGLTIVGPSVEMNVTVAVPDDYPESAKADATAYCSNVMGHALVKAIIRDAISAT